MTTLKRQSAQMSTLVAGLRTVRNQLPISSNLPAVIDQLTTQARESRVSITSLSIGSATAAGGGVAAATAGSTSDSTDSGGSSASTPTASPSATGATTGSTAGTAATGTTATAAGPAGQLFQIAFTVITSGSLAQQEAFLTAVQYAGPRTALVTSTQLGSGQNSETSAIGLSSSLTTQLDVFVAPQTPAVAAQLLKQLNIAPAR